MPSVEELLAFLQTLMADPDIRLRYGRDHYSLVHRDDPTSAPKPTGIPDSPQSPPECPPGIPDSPESPPECPPVRRSWRDSPWCPKDQRKAQASPQLTSRANPHDRSRSPISLEKEAQFSDMSEDEAPAKPTESDGYETYSSASEEQYTVVNGGKRKKDKASSRASKAKKTPVASSTPPPSKLTLDQTKPAKVTASSAPSRPSSPFMAVPPKKVPRPPPIYLQDKARWSDVSQLCTENKISFTNATACQDGIKIQVATPNDYRSMTRFLKDRKFPFHTYYLPEDTPTRVVIRRVPKEIPTEEIRLDLLNQKVPVVAVHRLHKARGGQQYDMVLVICSHTEGHNPIFGITSVCSLSGISIEKPFRPHVVGQCHRCQLYGHSQTNCYATPRCVKCLGDHGTKDCSRPKDPTQCTEPPSCVLCGQVGHPANYRGCPKAPKPSSQMAKRHEKRQGLEAPSTRLPTSQVPTRLAPQRTSPWGKLNHKNVAPQPNPQPIPALMAHPIPAPAPISAQTTASVAMRPLSVAPSGKQPYRCVAQNIMSAYSIWMTPEARALDAELSNAGEMTAQESSQIFAKYSALTEYLDNIVFRNGQWVRK